MLASNFYATNMVRGGKNPKKDAISAPKLSAGNSSKTGTGSGRGRGGRGGRVVPAAVARRQILVEPRSNRSNDHDEDEVDSENEELDDLEVRQEEEQEEEDESEEDFDWKCRLLETIQQYPEVFDLADPRYKDCNKRDAAWEEIATAMDATGQSIYMLFPNIYQLKSLFSTS